MTGYSLLTVEMFMYFQVDTFVYFRWLHYWTAATYVSSQGVLACFLV